jgi:hypothetical protein
VALFASAFCAALLGLFGTSSSLLRLCVPHGGRGRYRRSGPAGRTLAVHSMLGYIGGFIGPLAVRWILDVGGSMSPPSHVFRGPPWAYHSMSRGACLLSERISPGDRLRDTDVGRGHPGKISMVSGGMGTAAHLSGELFKMMAGVNMLHVPYRGIAPALTDLLGAEVHFMSAPMSASIEHIRAGKLRTLAVTTATRSEMLPDVPTVGEFVPGYEASTFVAGYEASTWSGVGAPKATPGEIVEKLNKEIHAALADHKIKARLVDLGSTALEGSPADF